MHSLYVLWSDSKLKNYVGISTDLQTGLKQHNAGYVYATRNTLDWRIIHIEQFEDRSGATKRESFLKSGDGRRVLVKIIEDKLGAVA